MEDFEEAVLEAERLWELYQLKLQELRRRLNE